MKKQQLLFANLKQIKDHWVNTAVSSLEPNADLIWSNVEEDFNNLQKLFSTKEEKEAFRKVLNDIVAGVMHSTLVMIDGGDALADSIKIDLIDASSRESLKNNKALHEEFYGYLFDVE